MRKLVGLLAFLAVIALCTTSYADLILEFEDLDTGATYSASSSGLDVNASDITVGEWHIFAGSGHRGADVRNPVLQFGHIRLQSDDSSGNDASAIRITLYTVSNYFNSLLTPAWDTFLSRGPSLDPTMQTSGSVALEVKIDDATENWFTVFSTSDTFNPGERVDLTGSFDITDYTPGSPKDLRAATPGFDMALVLTLQHDSPGGETDCTCGGFSPVPEPATMLLVGAGLLGIGIYGRRRKT